MKRDITLVIMAAGMGSRFGGLKQIEPMGPNDEFIIDYSVYDAIKAGFNKIIFIIKKENYDLFKETIGKRVEPHIKVEYVFQELSNIPEGYIIPAERKKPLGTAHAILCCKDFVHEPFAVINSDDFYGRDAYLRGYDFLNNSEKINNYGIIGYKINNTLTENGSVKRGVCTCNGEYLVKLTESKVQKEDDKIIAYPLDESDPFIVDTKEIASMNFLLFKPNIFDYLEELFSRFFDKNKDNMLKAEFFIPDVLEELIEKNKITVNVIKTDVNWYGVTYRKDTESVRKALKDLVDKGEYSNTLWQ